MLLFLLTFFTIYGGVHFYAFLKTKAAFSLGLKSGMPVALFMLLMVLAPVTVYFLEKYGLNIVARMVSSLGYIWMGLLFIFISISLAIDVYRFAVHLGGFMSGKDISAFLLSPKAAFFIALTIGLLASGYGYFEANHIRTERIEIKSPKIKRPVKILQISDMHLGLIVRKHRLEKILEAMRAEEPDIVVSTGDLVDGQLNDLHGLAELLRSIEPPLGKYAITGNHEFYAGKQALLFTERAGFTFLRGEAINVEGYLNIVGVDDPTGGRYYGLPKDGAEKKLLEGLSQEEFTLLLKHRPEVSKDSVGIFDLQLSGHTHRGQIFPFRFLTRIFYRYVSGFYKLSGNSNLYVSRGTGTWGPPIRVLAPPEVTVIELSGGNWQQERQIKQ
jgi:predicted MPP superfamily phosphohydrolase